MAEAMNDNPAEERIRVLLVSGMLPTPASPLNGLAVQTQIRSLQKAGIEVDVFNIRLEGGSLLGSWKKYRERLQSKSYSLAHVHYGIKATLLTLFSSVPVVATYHGTDVNGWVWKQNEPWWRAASYNIAAFAVRLLSRRLRAVIVMTDEMKSRLPASVRRRTHVIPMGIDSSMFRRIPQDEARRQLGWPPGRVVLFANNNGEIVKRQDLAEAAMVLVQDAVPDARMLVLRGMKHSQMPLVLSAADCLLVTSDKEGSPNIVRESILCGLPIVSVEVGDVPNLLRKYEGTGSIVSREPSEIAGALIELLRKDRPKVNELAREDLSQESIAEKVLRVYRHVLA